MKNRLSVIVLCLVVAFYACQSEKAHQSPTQPNIVIIYVDDLGYGDVGVYGATGIETPHIDRLAAQGLRFTNAYSAAATCTPSRYSLLTGRYAFRNEAAILPGDAPLLIEPGMPTLPAMLQHAGYKTAVVGKWHLGLGDGTLDWNSKIAPGPLEIGFDYAFLIPATGDRVPCVFVENHHVVGGDPDDPITVSYGQKVGDYPDGLNNPELRRVAADTQHSATIVNGISRIGYMAGGKEALWVDEEFPDILLHRAEKFISEKKEQPFFLYFSLHDIHVPRLPHKRFQNQTEMGVRGDVIVQMDWCTGRMRELLEQNGLSENTLILFTSDNGPVLNDGYDDKSETLIGDHHPGGPFRGGKYSIFEAGTRVPTIAYWPGVIQPGVTEALFSQVDLYASIAAITGRELTGDEAVDSYDLSPALTGKSTRGRDELVEEAFTLALRQGPWKYIHPAPERAWIKNDKDIESGLSDVPQLYHLENDVAEQENLATKYPEKVKEMAERLQQIKQSKDSRLMEE